jgi:hypothetical protein
MSNKQEQQIDKINFGAVLQGLHHPQIEKYGSRNQERLHLMGLTLGVKLLQSGRVPWSTVPK